MWQTPHQKRQMGGRLSAQGWAAIYRRALKDENSLTLLNFPQIQYRSVSCFLRVCIDRSAFQYMDKSQTRAPLPIFYPKYPYFHFNT
jgi:hypothetical protein